MTTKPLNQIIGENIRELRQRRGVSIEHLSSLLDLSPSFFASIERGERSTTIRKILIIAKIFDVRLDDLVTDKSQPKSYLFYEDNKYYIKVNKIKLQLYNLEMNKINFVSEIIECLRRL